ncbi:MAG: efflux RND transporter permease subunit [Leucobacter sp.]
MHLLTALSLKNRALIALVTIVAAVFGLIGVGSLKQELMPSVQFPAIAVVTSYPGASPEVVNHDVSGPIETALRGVPQLESTTATSSTGSSMVVAQFTYGVDIAATEQKVERAVSRISQLLPEQSDSQVLSGSIDDFPVIQIAVTPADGDTPEQTAQLVERVAIPDLSDLEGVRDAQLTGAREDRITIRPDDAALAAQGLSSQSIADTLQQSGVLIAAGTITDGDRTLAVQAGSAVTSAEEIAALPLPRSPEAIAAEQQSLLAQQPADGAAAALTIGDVAEVKVEPSPQQSISRVDGKPALTIAVTKMSAANTVDVSHAVQQKLDELQDQLGGAKLSVIFDQAPYVEQSIHTLTTEGLLGLLFAVLVILVFLMSVRATLVTAISIPTSVLLTFVGLNSAEYTLNMLTLGALTISIGRVVDDSIVVIENIKRHLSAGGDRAKTIVEAVREVAGAVTASTVTTVAVFLPMVFVDGMVGELFRPFAFTVAIALAASLLVSLTIVPVLAYWFLRAGRPKRRSTAAPEPERPTALQRGYRPIIEWTLRRPAVTLLIAVVVFGATIAASPLMKTNFMGSDEQNSVGLVQTLDPGTSLDAQLVQAERVEEALAEVPSIETVQVTIGSAGSGMSAIFGGGGDGSVSYSLTTDPDADQLKVQEDIRAAVDALGDAGEFSLGQSGGGVTTSSAIEINVSAPDQQTLEQASSAVVDALRDRPELEQVESDLGMSRPFLRVSVDRAAAAAAGLTEAGVAGQVAQQMQPRQIGQVTLDADTMAVYLAAGTAPDDQAGVAALQIQTALGPQRLDALAAIEVADGPVTVRTEDGVRMVTVSALPQGDDLGTASVGVEAALDSVDLPAGATASVGGVMSQQTEAFQQLGIALLAAILIVYVVMVATFRSLLQPLLLLVSVPFAATGAILLLIVTGIPLGVASLIGVLMLVGIVVTNAIVLIDLVNQYRSRGDGLRDAVLHGSMQRLRPIVMTALATILALTPMALGITGKGGFISQPLAVVVIGGLLSSTVLTLIVLPTLYYAVERRRRGGDPGPRRRRGAGSASPVGDAGAAGVALAGTGPVRAGAGAVRTRAGAAAAGIGAVSAGAGAVSTGGAAVGAEEALADGTLAGETGETPERRRASAVPGPRRRRRRAAETATAPLLDEPVAAAPISAAPVPAAPVSSVPVAVAPVAAAPVAAAPVSAASAPAEEAGADPDDGPAFAGGASFESEPAPDPALTSDPAPESGPVPAPDPVSEPEPATEPDPEAAIAPGIDVEPEPRTVFPSAPVSASASGSGNRVGIEADAGPEFASADDPDPVVELEPEPQTQTATAPEPELDEDPGSEAMRPETARLSLALADLGFDSDAIGGPDDGLIPLVLPDPLFAGEEGERDRDTVQLPHPVHAAFDGAELFAEIEGRTDDGASVAPGAETDGRHSGAAHADPESVPVHAAGEDPSLNGDPEADEDPEADDPIAAALEAANTGSLPIAERRAAPPVTGELNWEELMWQATQEIDEEEASDRTPPDASGSAHREDG